MSQCHLWHIDIQRWWVHRLVAQCGAGHFTKSRFLLLINRSVFQIQILPVRALSDFDKIKALFLFGLFSLAILRDGNRSRHLDFLH